MYVVATAGHVDHGKSTLVRALTGIEPDRFAEERRRGLTIDLGYAWTEIAPGRQLAFVDVPGHQRFIANMLAGLGPAPAVLFVVAADEGWSRQSDEHLAAIDALDVRHGLLAVTRSDRADPSGTLADARTRIARSSLGEVEAVPVSGTTGAGLDELRAALGQLLDRLPVPDASAPVRLWLDRSFSITGAGTVVTGTLSAGTVSIGDELTLGERVVVVRGLQTTGDDLPSARATARVALNLRGVKPDSVGRGDVLLTPDTWRRTDTVDVRLSHGSLPVELVLHVGTAAVPVRVRPLDDTHARIALASALPLRAGDRAVLRDPGRQAVAAGALVLDADPPPLRRRGAASRRATELSGATGTPDLATEVARRGLVAAAHLERLGVTIADIPDVRRSGNFLVAPDTWTSWHRRADRVLARWAAEHPLEPAPTPRAFGSALGLPDDPGLLGDLVADAGLETRDGRIVRAGAAPSAPVVPGIAALADRFARNPFAAPDRDELASLKLGHRELTAAARAGAVLRVAPDIVLAPDAADRAVETLRTIGQPFTLSAARQALGSTRRVVVPLLEHLDTTGRTERVDANLRRVR